MKRIDQYCLLIFTICLCSISVNTYAQDNIYTRTAKTVLTHAKPWEPIKETDVKLMKRIWRELNVDDQKNMAIRHANDDRGLIDILNVGVRTGTIEAYADEKFSQRMSFEQIRDVFHPENISRLDIKEDLIMYGEDGKLVVHILGIAPMKAVTIADSTVYQPICWIYFPATRDYLAQYIVENKETDTRITWDDFFEDRLFNSKITKLSGRKAQ